MCKRDSNGLYAQTQRLPAPEGNRQTESYHSPQVLILDNFLLVGSHEYKKVYVFSKTGVGTYRRAGELAASDPGQSSSFGVKVGGHGDDVLVSDRLDDSSYLFVHKGGVWRERAKFRGYHTALSGDSIVVHSPPDFGLSGDVFYGYVKFYDLVCELA